MGLESEESVFSSVQLRRSSLWLAMLHPCGTLSRWRMAPVCPGVSPGAVLTRIACTGGILAELSASAKTPSGFGVLVGVRSGWLAGACMALCECEKGEGGGGGKNAGGAWALWVERAGMGRCLTRRWDAIDVGFWFGRVGV